MLDRLPRAADRHANYCRMRVGRFTLFVRWKRDPTQPWVAVAAHPGWAI